MIADGKRKRTYSSGAQRRIDRGLVSSRFFRLSDVSATIVSVVPGFPDLGKASAAEPVLPAGRSRRTTGKERSGLTAFIMSFAAAPPVYHTLRALSVIRLLRFELLDAERFNT